MTIENIAPMVPTDRYNGTVEAILSFFCTGTYQNPPQRRRQYCFLRSSHLPMVALKKSAV